MARKIKSYKNKKENDVKSVDQKKLVPLFLVLLAVGVLAAFSPCFGFQFLRWDDYGHFYSNPCVYSLSWYNICNLFGQTVNDTYIPLTTLSFNLEYHLFGLSPYAAHMINVLLHLAIVWAIFNLARSMKFSAWESFFAAAIFALHPIHVESVAWVTERKDVLSIFLYVLCLKQYWLYLQNNSSKNYGLSLLFGFLSVLAKPMAVSLPWILLLLDWYAQRRPSRTKWLDKLPFVILIFPIAAVTFLKLSPHPHVEHNSILIGLWTFSWYLEKFLFPFSLLPAYSPPLPVTLDNLVYSLSVLISIVFICSIFVWRKNRLFIFACIFWIMTIFFFWRFDFGDIDIVADRFMYLPSLGFCLLLGRYLSKFKSIGVAAALVLGFLTFDQCHIWRNDMTLWTWALDHDPKNVLAKLKQDEEIYSSKRKMIDFNSLTEAIDKDPLKANVYLERGKALLDQKDFFLAFSDFNKAVELEPSNFMNYDMRGQLYSLKGKDQKALEDFNKAISLKPDDALAYSQIATIKARQNDIAQALSWFDKAIKINPKLGGNYYQRGLLFISLGEYKEAIDDLTRSIALNNDLKNSYLERGLAYEGLKQYEKAEDDLNSSLREEYYNLNTLNELGIVYLKHGNFAKAMETLNNTIAMHPYNENAYSNRGNVYIKEKRYDLALKDFTSVIHLALYPYHALITRGDLYFVMKERPKALEDYKMACHFANGDPIAEMRREHLENVMAEAR